MEFDILGPTSVQIDGQPVRLGPPSRRSLLSLLILRANRPVSAEQLLDALGVEAGPRPPRTTLRSHIAELRRILGPERLRTVSGGYALSMAEKELDAAIFQAELRQAQAAIATDDPVDAAVKLERGLARWVGPALVDAAGAPWASGEARRLNALHDVAEETLLDVRLALGRHEEVIELAEATIDRDPVRESAWACLMLALYRSGHIAEAVRAYQRLRTVLQTVDGGRLPSAELINLERAILHRDPSLATAQRPRTITPTATPVASERVLPGGVVTFLMTDVVGSTRLWETAPSAMRAALERHDELMKIAVEYHDGILLRERGEGDSTFSVFGRATDAATAALAAQLSLSSEPWPPECVIQVRMAMHTGEASQRDGDYYGRPVNRVARLRAIADAGQILVGQSAAEILFDHLPAGTGLTALGVKELRDFERPETVYLLGLGRATVDTPATSNERGSMDVPAVETAPPEVTTLWLAVVDADLGYYEQSNHKDAAFPRTVDRRLFPLMEQTVLIGRPSSSHDVPPHIDMSPPFEDPGVSRTHAKLDREPDGSYVLIDPGSTNGTFLNNWAHPITRRVRIPLSTGDQIYLGLWTRIQIQAP